MLHKSYALLLVLLLCLLPLSSRPPARAATPQQFVNPNPQPPTVGYTGMNTYFTGLERLWNDTIRDSQGTITADGTATLIALGRQAAIPWAREELSWANIEGLGRKKREWGVYDDRLRQIAAAGYGIIGMVSTTPQWARPADCDARINQYAAQGTTTQRYWCPPAAEYLPDFANTLGKMVERYDGDGAYDASGSPRVAVWQIWNEPSAWETWPGSPAEYGNLLVAAYAAVKQADPTALVSIGGVYVFDGSWNDGRGHQDGMRFYDQVFATVPAAWHSFDILAVHPYMPDVAPDQPGLYAQISLWGRIQHTQTWLAAWHARTATPLRPLWITEVGWSTCSTLLAAGDAAGDPRLARYNLPTPLGKPGEGQVSLASNLCRTEPQQANYMLRTHAIALALGVQHVNYFQLEDKFDGDQPQWGGHSILDTFATGYRPKVAYGAYAVLNTLLVGAQVFGISPLHAYAHNPNSLLTAGVQYGVRFRAADGAIIDLVWLNSGARVVRMPLELGATVEVRTRDWLPVPFSVEHGAVVVGLGEDPLYIRQVLPPAPSPFASPTPVPPTATPVPPTATPIPLLPPAEGRNGQVTVAPNQAGTLQGGGSGSAIAVQVPPFAVQRTTTISYTTLTTHSLALPPELRYAGRSFRLDAWQDGQLLPTLAFEQPLTLTVELDARYLSDDDHVLWLYRRTANSWQQASVGLWYVLDAEARQLSAAVQQTGEYVLVQAPPPRRSYLPLVRR